MIQRPAFGICIFLLFFSALVVAVVISFNRSHTGVVKVDVTELRPL